MKTNLFNQIADIISPYPINDQTTVLNDIANEVPLVELPKNLTCNHPDYHQVEVAIDDLYYMVVYLGEVNDNYEDFTITIGKVERASASDIDSEYQRIYTIEKPIYDQLVKAASDEYDYLWFEEDAENARECHQDQLDDLRINQE